MSYCSQGIKALKQAKSVHWSDVFLLYIVKKIMDHLLRARNYSMQSIQISFLHTIQGHLDWDHRGGLQGWFRITQTFINFDGPVYIAAEDQIIFNKQYLLINSAGSISI